MSKAIKENDFIFRFKRCIICIIVTFVTNKRLLRENFFSKFIILLVIIRLGNKNKKNQARRCKFGNSVERDL